MNQMLRQLYISAEIISNCCVLSYFVPYLNERMRGVPSNWLRTQEACYIQPFLGGKCWNENCTTLVSVFIWLYFKSPQITRHANATGLLNRWATWPDFPVPVRGGTVINLYNTDNQNILPRRGPGLVAQVGLECKTFLLSYSPCHMITGMGCYAEILYLKPNQTSPTES